MRVLLTVQSSGRKRESNIVREAAGPIGVFISQGAATSALTIAVPGVQPAAQEKGHEPGLAVLFFS